MPRGGRRAGAGRKAGSKNRIKLQLESESREAQDKAAPISRMKALRRRVCLLRHAGMSVEKIAAVLGMAIDKFEAVFPREIELGADLIRAEIVGRLDAAGEQGHVGANRALDSMATPDLEFDPRPKKSAEERLTRPLGKKVQAQLEGQSRELLKGTPWEGILDGPYPEKPQ